MYGERFFNKAVADKPSRDMLAAIDLVELQDRTVVVAGEGLEPSTLAL